MIGVGEDKQLVIQGVKSVIVSQTEIIVFCLCLSYVYACVAWMILLWSFVNRVRCVLVQALFVALYIC